MNEFRWFNSGGPRLALFPQAKHTAGSVPATNGASVEGFLSRNGRVTGFTVTVLVSMNCPFSGLGHKPGKSSKNQWGSSNTRGLVRSIHSIKGLNMFLPTIAGSLFYTRQMQMTEGANLPIKTNVTEP